MIKATKLFSGVMVTKVLKLFTAGIVRWKSNFDHTLLLKLPPINCERALLVFFAGLSFLANGHNFGRYDCAVRKLYKATKPKRLHVIPVDLNFSKSFSDFGSPRRAAPGKQRNGAVSRDVTAMLVFLNSETSLLSNEFFLYAIVWEQQFGPESFAV